MMLFREHVGPLDFDVKNYFYINVSSEPRKKTPPPQKINLATGLRGVVRVFVVDARAD